MEMILTDIQILELMMCAVLSFVAYKVKMPSVALIPAIGLFVLGFQIYSSSDDLLILALFYITAILQFVICMGSGRRR